MHTDLQLTSHLERMIDEIDAPPVNLKRIRERITDPPTPRSPVFALRLTVAAAALFAICFVALPKVAPAFVASLEVRYRAALQAIGIQPPPQAPRGFAESLRSEGGTIATLQSKVPFTIVAPSGLPSDVAQSTVQATQTGEYSPEHRAWRKSSWEIVFSYRRANGRTFRLIADRYDPLAAPPPKYLFEPRESGTNGAITLIKHEHFAWRNGEQMMLATAGDALSSEEIRAIESAMHATPIHERDARGPNPGGRVKLYRVPKP